MKKALLLLYFSCIQIMLCAQDKVSYDILYKRVCQLPTNEIIRIGDNYLKKQELDTAIVLYTIASGRFSDNMTEEEKRICAISYLKTANIYYSQGNYTNALELYIKGLKICESCKYKQDIPEFYKNIGNVYCAFQDYEKGVNNYEEGYRLCKLYPNKELEYKILSNLTGICCYIKETEKAKVYFYKAEKLKGRNDTIKNYMSLLNKGIISVNDRKYNLAIDCFLQSVEYARKFNMEPRYVCSSYEELYKVYSIKNNDDSTLYYLRLCYEVSKQNSLMDMLSQSLKSYSKYYETKGDINKSINYKSQYLSLADSIFNVREFSRIKNAQFLYESEKTNNEIFSLHIEKEKKEQEIKRQRKILIGILSGFLIISILLIIVYRQKRKLFLAYKNLFNINREVVDSEKYNKELRLQYEEKLKDRDLKLKELYGQLNISQQIQESITEEQNDESFELKTKYQASNLNDRQKQLLQESIREIMESTQEFCKEDFSLDKLAALINSNSRYVSQVINETYQKNFNTFINEYRIREARLRLMDLEHYGNYTIKAIAESVGYKSHATFINVFRKITGITPSIYQKMAKEELDI